MNEPYYNHNYLKLMKSSDGVHWSPPVTVIDWSLAENPLYVSPAIVEVSSGFVLWAVDAGRFTLRSARSSDGVTFGSLQPVGLGDQIWHVNVEYVPTKHEYWMLYDYPSSPLGVVRLARSVDGLTWTTYTNRALTYTNGWDASLYRSAFLYDPGTNLLRVWYSAHSSSAVWHVGQTSFDYDKFLAQLLTPPWTVRQGSGSWAVSAARVRRGNLSGRLVQLSTSSIWARKAAPLGNNFYLESDVYDDLDSTAFTMVRAVNPLDKRLGVGVWTGSSGSKYVFHDQNYRYVATTKARTVGWHKFGILIRSDASVTYYIDGQNVGSLTGQFNDASRIHVEGYYRAPTTYYVDDIRVRTWNAVAPRALVGAEQAQPV